jgi:hypothetical protein
LVPGGSLVDASDDDDANFRVYLDGWVMEKFLNMNVTGIWHDL